MTIHSSTRAVDPAILDVLDKVKPGQKIRITQTVRVARRHWTTTVTGAFREVRYLATGISTDRLPEDDIVVPTIHFEKDVPGQEDPELSSIAIDEHTKIEIV